MNKLPVIGADIFQKASVGSADQREDVLRQVYQARHSTPAVKNTNENCWRSDVRYTGIEWLLNEVVTLTDAAVDYYNQIDLAFKSANFKKPYSINYWSNVNAPGSRNVVHSHKGAHFACVYYLQATGTGDLRLINPANILSDVVVSAPFARDFYFKPTDGDLILWPGWVPHEVEPNLSNKDRVNIVFDITL